MSRMGHEEVPVVTDVEVLVGMVEMSGPVISPGAAAEQAAAESLLVLASPPLAGGS